MDTKFVKVCGIFTVLLSLNVSSHAIAYSTSDVNRETPKLNPAASPHEVPALFEVLSDAEIAKKLTEMAEKGAIISYDTFPDAFLLLKSSKAMYQYMDFFAEPLSSARLDQLKQVVIEPAYETDAKERAACLLLRYDDLSGVKFLQERYTQTHNPLIVQALLVNDLFPESETDSLVETLRYCDDSRSMMCNRWKELAVLLPLHSSPSLAQKIHSALESHPSNSLLLAAARISDSNSLHNKLDAVYDQYLDRDNTVHKLMIAANMVRVKGDSAAATYLIQMLQRDVQPFSLWKMWVIIAMERSGSQDFVDAITHFIENEFAARDNSRTNHVGSVESTLIEAIEAVIRLKGNLPDNIQPQVYQFIENTSTSALQGSLLSALFRSQDESTAAIIRQRLGDNRASKIKSILRLKSVPEEFLPKESRKWESGY